VTQPLGDVIADTTVGCFSMRDQEMPLRRLVDKALATKEEQS
jgi:hypothetical protein